MDVPTMAAAIRMVSGEMDTYAAALAYAAAAAGGYDGTKEQFEEILAAYASVGEDAARSAASAEAAKDAAVAAAEQIYNHAKKSDPEGTLRRGYARKAIVYMAHKCGISLTEEEIEAMIEAAVNEINGSKLNVIECMEAEK